MTGPDVKDLYRLLDEEGARPLGAVRVASNHTRAPVSEALLEAADNLLRKALQAVRDHDEARARRFVERAVALPFDEHEQIGPGWWAASMLMFLTIIDRLEGDDEDEGEAEDAWLTAAERVLERCDPSVALLVRGHLTTIADDYHLSAAEVRRCRRAAAGIPADTWAADEPADPEQRAAAVLGVLGAVVDYLSDAPRR